LVDEEQIKEFNSELSGLNAKFGRIKFPGKKSLVWYKNHWLDLGIREFPSDIQELKEINITMGNDEYESTGFVITNIDTQEKCLIFQSQT